MVVEGERLSHDFERRYIGCRIDVETSDERSKSNIYISFLRVVGRSRKMVISEHMGAAFEGKWNDRREFYL